MIGLVPRLNIRYSISDAYVGLKSIFKSPGEIPDDTFYLNHARTGLRIALSSLNLNPDSKIAVMVYNCYTVMKAVQIAGYEIEFIDINEDFTIDYEDLQRKRDNIDAIIVTHLFGIPNDINRIRKILPDIPVIEDCAHAYLSTVNRNPAGSLGDLAVFSMGLAKFPSIGSGGYLVVNNELYFSNVQKIVSELNRTSIKSEFLSIAKNIILGLLHNSLLYKYITKPILKQKNNSIDDDHRYDSYEANINRSTLGLFISKQNKFPLFLEKQKTNARNIIQTLNKLLEIKIKTDESVVFEPNRFMIPFLFQDREFLVDYFKENGVELGTHFSKSIEWAKKFGYIEGNCIKAERICNTMLVIPCHYNLKTNQVQLINQLISNLI